MLKSKAMKWVKALRSGKFKQGTEQLRYMDGEGDVEYCCLGVLAKINGFDEDELFTNTALVLPEFDRCGLKTSEGEAISDKGINMPIKLKGIGESYGNLALANDNGATFKSIATWIEKNYKLL